MIYIEVKGVGQVIRNLDNYSRSIPIAGKRGVYLFANHLAAELRKEAKAKGHKNTGYLSSKKGTDVIKIGKDEWGIKMPFYTEYLETGTRPHWIPNMAKTRLWARKHGMSFYEMRSIIHKKGTRAHPFTGGVINREVKKLKDKVEQQINTTIKQGGR